MSLIFHIIILVKDRNRFVHRLVNFKDNFALPTKFCWQAICLWGNSLSECQKRIDVDLPNSWKLEITTYIPAGSFLCFEKPLQNSTLKIASAQRRFSTGEKKSATKWLEKPYMQKKVLQNTNEMTMHKKIESGLKKKSCFQDVKKSTTFAENVHLS